jgi:subfamily B ATP-binding cassette protein MsbA
MHDYPFQVFCRLLRYVSGSWGRMALVFLGLAVSSSAMLVIPWLAGTLLYQAILEQQAEAVYRALGLLLVVLLAHNLARFLSDDQLEVVSLQLTDRVRDALVDKLLRLPARYFTENRSGEVVSRTFNDVRVLKDFTHHACIAVGGDLLRIAGAAGMLFWLNGRLALLLLTLVPVAGWILIRTSSWIRQRSLRAQSTLADMTSLLSEQVRDMPAVQAHDGAAYEQQRFAERAQAHFREGTSAHRIHAVSRAVINCLAALAVIGVAALGTEQLLRLRHADPTAHLPIEHLLGFTMYAALLGEPINRLSRSNFEIQRSLAAGCRLFEFLDLPEPQDTGKQPLTQRPVGPLQFEGVSFHYRPGEPVLADLDLTVEAGQTVALVGPSGAGKSTLAALVMRFYDPSAGRVLLDGCDLRQLRRADLHRHIGWMGQDPFLLSGTVLENIRYGTWDATRDEVEAAARLACADPFIRALPKGYDTRLGERGVDLSGGQRARLALARVILRNPALVVLDEVTAALDPETEVRFWHGLRDWLAGRMTLIITHRLHTVLTCPRIVVLENGRKVGEGSAAQLQRTCPAFQRLFLEQKTLISRAA